MLARIPPLPASLCFTGDVQNPFACRAGRRSSCQLPILLSDLLRAVPNHGGRAALPPVAEFMHLGGGQTGRATSHLACSTSSRPEPFRCAAAPARWRRAHSLACAAGSSPTSGRAAVQDVRVIRGVGPVNAALLMAQDIGTVSMLQQVYHHSLQSDKNELQRFLSVRLPQPSLAQHLHPCALHSSACRHAGGGWLQESPPLPRRC